MVIVCRESVNPWAGVLDNSPSEGVIKPPSVHKNTNHQGESLVPLSTDEVLLPLPHIVLSSSTFPPLPPPAFTSLPNRTPFTSTQQSRIWDKTKNNVGWITTTPIVTTSLVDDSLQRNYEEMFIEKVRLIFNSLELWLPIKMEKRRFCNVIFFNVICFR